MAPHAIHQIVGSVFRPSILISRSRLKLPYKISAACITSKAFRDPTIEKPKPWPYKTKRYTWFHSLYDFTMKRFDENTKIIVVDGNIGAGKTTFARQLAEEFDMHLVPEANMERYYINPYGYDIREIDDLMPPSFKSCDLKTFYANPHDQNVAKFQFKMFMARFEDYIDALAHLLNTGQGIVMDRSAYSDFVFMEAMFKSGYIRRQAKDMYYELYEACTKHLLRPHLVVYLDVPVDVVLERIKERNNPIEVNSKVLTREYLQNLEDVYKNRYLKNTSKHSEILMYDWSHFGDVEVVVEDIEKIDLDRFDKYSTKMGDWVKDGHWEWSYLRRRYSHNKHRIMLASNILRYDVTELFHPRGEYIEYMEVLEKVPGQKYAKGYNAEMGEKFLFKLLS